jgi:hypothetical protein
MTMAPHGTTVLRLDAHRTTLSNAAADDVVVAVGMSDIAEGLFQHEPPTPLEMERAIDLVEDALTATGLRHAARGELQTDDPRLLASLGSRVDDARLGRDEVEAIFQRLASASLGHPGLWESLPSGRDAAASLLILRECMHHLGYDAVRRVGA